MSFRKLAIASVIILLSCAKAEKEAPSGTGIPNPIESDEIIGPSHDFEINTVPIVTELRIISSEEGNTFSFDLEDDDPEVDVKIYGLSIENGEYVEITSDWAGDVGTGIAPGENKIIQWTQQGSTDYSKIKVVANDGRDRSIPYLVNLVSKQRIISDVGQMTGIRHYQSGPNLLSQTRDYIDKQFGQYGLSVDRHTFSWQSTQGINIIGNHLGSSPNSNDLLIIAHYDTVGNTPGADDNLSGTAGMLEAMRVLSQFEYSESIRFIGFDLEEQGLIGSSRYVSEIAQNQNIMGVVNFEMIGYTCRSPICANLQLADTSIYNIANPNSSTLRINFDEKGSSYVSNLGIVSVEADGDPNFRRSDHALFWDAGIPALFITDGANFRNPHYHKSSDSFDTLDFDFTTKIVKTAVATIASLAGIKTAGEAIIGI
ncbi:M28 family metallopeptidase [Flagellimonas eckloniae]|uniref:Peptidase M28 domain-containing protein n=1 Tax=Flagellimonas eckloniae TaxID=346185 RepID=A0A0Q0WUI6_9FLAO|nr:M28 family peptidase [Allomuricauda eckloniae]KQC29092.1 hypothetical protein AAY42_03655 [Allomuricauda eckloniae]